MPLTSISFTLSGAQFSDLFFNYEHPARDALYARFNGPAPLCDLIAATLTEDEERAAVLEDANEFLATLGHIDTDLAEALADDFMRRR